MRGILFFVLGFSLSVFFFVGIVEAQVTEGNLWDGSSKLLGSRNLKNLLPIGQFFGEGTEENPAPAQQLQTTQEKAANTNANPENTQNNKVAANAADDEGQLTTAAAAYNAADKTITYKDADGNDVSVAIADIGLSEEWLSVLSNNGNTLSVTLSGDGEVKLITGSDSKGAKKWEYDPQTHAVMHYTGSNGNERPTVVTSEEQYTGNYVWYGEGVEDPGAGPDGHMVMQRFNYDGVGELAAVDYFTYTASGTGSSVGRYMYRQDSVAGKNISGAVESLSVTCGDDCYQDCYELRTKFYDDPLLPSGEPTLTGTVMVDNYRRYWLSTDDGKWYLLTARQDNVDADNDGFSGADEMNQVDWQAMEGETITVRGYEMGSSRETGIYVDGNPAEIFEVSEILTEDEKAALGTEGIRDFEITSAVLGAVMPDPDNRIPGTLASMVTLFDLTFGDELNNALGIDLSGVINERVGEMGNAFGVLIGGESPIGQLFGDTQLGDGNVFVDLLGGGTEIDFGAMLGAPGVDPLGGLF
ncbi:MAG: hypothetical protein WC335_06375 [Candidatus Omnitrophota bacterium]